FSHNIYNTTSSTAIYTLSLHDALPIYFVRTETSDWSEHGSGHERVSGKTPARDGQPLRRAEIRRRSRTCVCQPPLPERRFPAPSDRKSTRLNSSHEWISYAVFCLKKNI